jgi:hypothetical protein
MKAAGAIVGFPFLIKAKSAGLPETKQKAGMYRTDRFDVSSNMYGSMILIAHENLTEPNHIRQTDDGAFI